jgi:hypothetical protein
MLPADTDSGSRPSGCAASRCTGGRWSAHQVLRVLANRIYVGELSFRGITCAGCHPPVIEQISFAEAQRILAARGEDQAKPAASGSDYLQTGLLRCPACGSAMLGTRAHGKTKTYRHYSRYRRTRYDTTTCGGQRVDADAIEQAVTSALADFYRHQHDLIADAQASHAADQDARRGELAATEHELARTGALRSPLKLSVEGSPHRTDDRRPTMSARGSPTRRRARHRSRSADMRGWQVAASYRLGAPELVDLRDGILVMRPGG